MEYELCYVILSSVLRLVYPAPSRSCLRHVYISHFSFFLCAILSLYSVKNDSYDLFVFQHVAGNIVENEIRHKEILQSSFDLLGELIKFNIEAFKAFDAILTTDQKFDKFVNMVNRSLVDSNMFIRSLILSLEHFRTDSSDKGT